MSINKQGKNAFFYIAFLIFFVQSVASQGMLRVQGKKIENDVQKDFIIRSVGMGGWMLQEGYMLHLGPVGQQYKIKDKIASVVGRPAMQTFYNQWVRLHTQKADIDSLAAWGFNAVRLPLHYRQFTLPIQQEPVKGKNTWLKDGFQYLDTVLNWCASNHIYLILDLHAAPGGQGHDLAISDRNPKEPSLWSDKANQDKTIALWTKLASRYKDEPFIGGYDILNETNWGFEDSLDIRGTQEKSNQPLRKLMIQITRAIRAVDKNHIIFLEGNGFANNYQGIFPLWDKNLVLSFHKYGNPTTKATIQPFLDYRQKYNVPLWLGESGENSNNWYTHTIRLMERHDIGWSWWPLKKMGINNPLEIKAPKNYTTLKDYFTGNGPKPDTATAAAILTALLRQVQIQHNIIHRDVIDAMFRQINDPTASPFKHLRLDPNKEVTIQAADYDLGAQGYAYMDRDTASYRYTPGMHSQGNRGHAYRNDGVDIHTNENGQPVVFHIEDGEWLHYTLDVPVSGLYRFRWKYRQPSTGSSVQLLTKNKPATQPVPLEPTSNKSFKWSDTKDIYLSSGMIGIKVRFNGQPACLKDLEIREFQILRMPASKK